MYFKSHKECQYQKSVKLYFVPFLLRHHLHLQLPLRPQQYQERRPSAFRARWA